MWFGLEIDVVGLPPLVEQPVLLYRPELLGEYLYTHSFIHLVSVRYITQGYPRLS